MTLLSSFLPLILGLLVVTHVLRVPAFDILTRIIVCFLSAMKLLQELLLLLQLNLMLFYN